MNGQTGKWVGVTTLLLAFALLVNGCASATPADPALEPAAPPVSHGGTVETYVALVDALRALGATVEPAGSIEQPFFPVTGQLLQINGQEVQVFEFETAEAGQATAGTVSATGDSVGTSMLNWVAPPHFYRAGRIIALYVGSDTAVLDLLRQVLGDPFAGQAE